MAIFIALIFQVLFVFFAMSINIALVVHDKINLQNAVDLAAYYGAQKQAEYLNAIAHNNYAIRQAWKLLAFRYRVIGTMGLDSHPNGVRGAFNTSDSAYAPGFNPPPSVCVIYKPQMVDAPDFENLCRNRMVNIPPLPQVRVIAGFLALNHIIAANSQVLRARYRQQCVFLGAINFWYSLAIMTSYRMEQANRIQVIRGLADTLTNSRDGDFREISGGQVRTGVRKTILKNLTFTNRNSFLEESFRTFNSMEGTQVEQWLPKIGINPTINFTDVSAASGCRGEIRNIQDASLAGLRESVGQSYFMNTLGGAALLPFGRGEPPPESPMSMTLGVEKNPWFVTYYGVKAQTQPRQLFWPMGSPVVLEARAFAKPFGGRIGPWHGNRWPNGDSRSSGNKIDQLLPDRTRADGLLDSPTDPSRFPNYSRYPGDSLGMGSFMGQTGVTNKNNWISLRVQYQHWGRIADSITAGSAQDTLAYDNNGNNNPRMRDFEIAAIAPDLFDVTYYSIEPNYNSNYLRYLSANPTAYNIPGTAPVRGDLGSRRPGNEGFSVQDQMQTVRDVGFHNPQSFYFIRERPHLLTSWVPSNIVMDFENFPSDRFGQCETPDDDFPAKVPGSCITGGGRTGYSVKLVSRNLLQGSSLPLAGQGGGSGAIANPPPADF